MGQILPGPLADLITGRSTAGGGRNCSGGSRGDIVNSGSSRNGGGGGGSSGTGLKPKKVDAPGGTGG